MRAIGGPLVAVAGLVKEFRAPAGGRGGGTVRAVAGVDLAIHQGEVYALVGESGSGKTTLGRCILRLVEPTSGRVAFDGLDVTALRADGLRSLRRQMQVVFQDPAGSLDPRMRVRDLVAEPLRTHLRLPPAELEARVLELLGQVRLGPIHLRRRPHELSGGQCQRVAIARALALRPRLVVLDEPTSSLDVSVQAQILNLLAELRARHGLTYLLITHDLTVVRHLADRVGVLYLGRLVEEGPAEAIFARPSHPYTRALLASAPVIGRDRSAPRPAIAGDIPAAAEAPPGCRFHPRCWLRERLDRPAACVESEPAMEPVGDGHRAACHYAGEAALALIEQGEMP